jgi:hypothetical protein
VLHDHNQGMAVPESQVQGVGLKIRGAVMPEQSRGQENSEARQKRKKYKDENRQGAHGLNISEPTTLCKEAQYYTKSSILLNTAF